MLLSAAARATELTTQEVRGRQIYRTGTSDSGTPILARISADSDPVPAGVLPCAGCHGRDGRGKGEGGVRPSNLQWSALTRPYKVATPGGRAHPPYTPSTLKRAITMGVDSAKQPLRPPMPRYELAMRDADDLVAYLRRLGDDPDPGVSDDTLRIGVLLPPPGSEREAVQTTVSAYFAGVRIFGRRIDIHFEDALSDDDFAVIAAQITGREEEVGRVAAEKQLPVIAALAAQSDDANRYLFQLLAGVEEQSVALVKALPADARVRIVHDASTKALADRLTRRFGSRIAGTGASAILVLGGPLPSPLPETILVPAPYTSDALLSNPTRKILVALPLDASKATDLPPKHRATCAAVLAASRLLVRGLERAGRDAGRESLIDTLESFRGEPTGLTPPITWTRTRHTGTSECVIVRVPQ
ncbi:MAG TPA: c-type cytochrome [Vicinamibacterales bacterium]|nr:c-type cytochrome [Vicinamibacterales bacterium]